MYGLGPNDTDCSIYSSSSVHYQASQEGLRNTPTVVQMAASMMTAGHTPTVDSYSSLGLMLLILIYIQEVQKNFIHTTIFSETLNKKLTKENITGALS